MRRSAAARAVGSRQNSAGPVHSPPGSRGELDHCLAIGRRRHRMGIAGEEPEPAPGLFLKLADVLTDGRLAEAETFPELAGTEAARKP